MSEPRQDRTDDQLEALLRATFAAESRRQMPDARPVPPFPTARPRTSPSGRRRWIGLSLVAAVLVAIVVGATFLVTRSMNAGPVPTPPGTSVPPSTVVPITSAPTGTPTTTASSAPAAATRQATVLGVTLTVPSAWKVAHPGDAAAGREACLSTGASRRDTGTYANNCELTMNVLGTPSAADVDIPFVVGEGALCGSSPVVPQQTVTADAVTVDGETAEHRVFTAPCVPGTVEQWTVATAPLVLFARESAIDDPTGAAQAAAAVRSAVLPGPRSARWVGDHGLVTGFAGSTLSIDRVTYRYGGAAVNENPATYDYPVRADATVEYDGAASPTRVDLTVDDLRALGADRPVAGVPALSKLAVTLATDGDQAVTVLLRDR